MGVAVFPWNVTYRKACKSEPQTSALGYLLFAPLISISDGWTAQKNEIQEIYIIYYWTVLLWSSSLNNLEKNMMLSDFSSPVSFPLDVT